MPQPPTAMQLDGVAVYHDLAYVSDGHFRQKLDLYLPDGTKLCRLSSGCTAAPFVWATRGNGVRSTTWGEDTPWPRSTIASANTPSFRPRSRTARPPSAGCAPTPRHYGLDPQRFCRLGSVGGRAPWRLWLGVTRHMRAFEVGEYLDQSSRVQAVVDYFGDRFPADDAHRRPMAWCTTRPTRPVRLVGGPIQDEPRQVARANRSPMLPGAPLF